MPSPLVRTKLHVPAGTTRPGAASPARATGSVATRQPRLTLVSAPAGFGKTTLLAAWAEAAAADEAARSPGCRWRRPSRRPASFWTYVVTALGTRGARRRAPARCRCCRRRTRRSRRCSPPCSTTSARCRTTSTWSSTTTTSPTARRSPSDVAFLLDHLPPHVHLVISTRADPPLPLARLRARGELVEIRAADLRFTLDEAAAYLNGVGRRSTSTRPTSPRWRPAPRAGSPRCSWPRCRCRAATTPPASSPASPATTATSSTTSSRRCSTASPTTSASFLLETSVLDRLSGPLCDAVTGGTGGKAMLEALERANLFVVPLDDQPPVVPLPPPLRRRPARAPARGATRRRRRAAPAGQRVVRRGRRARAGRPARAGGRRRRPGRRPDRSSPSRRCGGSGRRPPPALARRRCPTSVVRRPAGARRRASSAR